MSKRKHFSKALTILLAIVMVVTMMPAMAWAGATPEEEAAVYLKSNYVDNNKIITNGGDSVVKSEDGLQYTVGLKTTSGSTITSLGFKKEASNSSYISGWTTNADKYITAETATSTKSWSITDRPTEMEGDYTFTVTLKLYATGTDKREIDTGGATALASQDFTIVIKSDSKKIVTFKAVDKDTKSVIDNATVKVEKGWSTVIPTEGVYTLEPDDTYTVTATAAGYKEYENLAFSPTESGEVNLPMEAISYSNICFDIKDNSGNQIEGATVKVKKGYYTTVSPDSYGNYKLENGTEYSYTVDATNYTTATGTITPSVDKTVDVILEKNISKYRVFFKVIKADDNTEISGAKIAVTYEEYDDSLEAFDTIDVSVNQDGSFTLKKGTTYNYTITADGFKTSSSTFTPGGNEENIEKIVSIDADVPVDPADQEKVDAIREIFDKETGALRPNFAKDKNIAEMVKSIIRNYEGVNAEGITVVLKSSDNTEYIKEDGTIAYIKNEPSNYGNNSKNVVCTFAFKCNGAEAISSERTVTVGWDCDYFGSKIQAEADSLTWDKIKNANTDQSSIETDLTLPQILTTSARTAWSKLTWTSSNEDVISIEATGYDSLPDNKKGKVTHKEEDAVVTLTATLGANDTLLNTYVEKVSDFKTITKTFTVTVKGTGSSKPTEDELQAILDKYYTERSLTDFTSKKVIDIENCYGDIQLPRYTKIQDEEGKRVFANKEITVESGDTNVISINGYRAIVDFFQDSDKTVELTIKFTREGITVQKVIPITVRTVSEEALEKELAAMEYAKAHYFDGINDGKYIDTEHITGNLHAFREFYIDDSGNPVWVYDVKNQTGKGIIPDDYFEDTWEMEAAGYNEFKSSNPQIVQHENLVIHRDASPQQVTISSLLSSQRYGKFAESHPDNEKLLKLYKQEVSVTVVVLGTTDEKAALEEKISEAEILYETIAEGALPGQYPAGTKNALNAAIKKAQAVLKNNSVLASDVNAAIIELDKAIKTCASSKIQNTTPFTVKVAVRGTGPFKNLIMTVSDVSPQTSVWTVVKTLLDQNKYSYEIKELGGIVYLEAVTDPNGIRLAALDEKNSGWLYTVDGILPDIYMSQYKLTGNESIELYYTSDYTKDQKVEEWLSQVQQCEVTTSKDALTGTNITATPTEVTVSGTTATATVKSENAAEAIKKAKENKSAEIVLNVAAADTKGAETVKVQLDTATVKSVVADTSASLTVKTENGQVSLDREALNTVVSEAKGTAITLEVVTVSKPTETQQKAAGTNGQILQLTVKSGDKTISDFNKGKATVTVEISYGLKDKKVAAIHIAEDGKIEQMAGKTVKIDGKNYYTFKTPHFSVFALVDADELGLEVNDEEESIQKIKEFVSDMSLKARSSKTSKKNIKVTLTVDKSTAAAIKEIKDMGYTVKYKYYRSTKKASKYQAKITKTTKSFTNTAGKKGTRYYYKARIQVYDKDGKLVAQTALKQCKYAARKWTKSSSR